MRNRIYVPQNLTRTSQSGASAPIVRGNSPSNSVTNQKLSQFKPSASSSSLLFGLNLTIAQYLKSMDYSGSLAMFIPESELKQALLPYSNKQLLEYLLISNNNDFLINYVDELHMRQKDSPDSQEEYPLLICLLTFISELEQLGLLTDDAISYVHNPHCL